MQLTKQWVSGFVDGEGCFNIQKTKEKKSGVVLRHRFIVSQDKRSVSVLYGLKNLFKCGTVHKGGKNIMSFQVSNTTHLQNIIVPFFQKYTLQTLKRESFCLFVESLESYVKSTTEKNTEDQNNQKQHYKESVCSKKSFPPLVYNLSDGWFRGFIDAEGCFFVSIVKDYPRVQLLIGLQSKEKPLLVEMQKFLKCGALRKRKDGAFVLQVANKTDLEGHIFPKLQTKGGAVLLRTSKRISYQKFRKIVRLMLEKKHYTVPGLEKIKLLKSGLNKQDSI